MPLHRNYLYDQAQIIECSSLGGAAPAPQDKKGWKTHNFEVEDLHTYGSKMRVRNGAEI